MILINENSERMVIKMSKYKKKRYFQWKVSLFVVIIKTGDAI